MFTPLTNSVLCNAIEEGFCVVAPKCCEGQCKDAFEALAVCSAAVDGTCVIECKNGNTPGGGGGCFSGNTQVQVQDKGAVSIKDVTPGDRVLAASGKFERASFGHYDSTQEAEFLQFHMDAQSVLEVTPDHLLFLFGKKNPVRAESVKKGDALLTSEGTKAEVRRIKTIQKEGIYTLFTESGSLVVDGMVASSYVSVQEGTEEHIKLPFVFPTLSHHDMAHLVLSPFRLLCMGVSPRFCDTTSKDGTPGYGTAMMALKEWVQKQNIFVEAVVTTFMFLLASVSYLLETLFGGAYAPMVVGTLMAVVMMGRRFRLSRGTKSAA